MHTGKLEQKADHNDVRPIYTVFQKKFTTMTFMITM